MKKLLIPTFLLLIFSASYSQKLTTNEVDEFTHHAVKRTSWETLSTSMKIGYYIRISKIDDILYLDLKVLPMGKAFALQEGDDFMFKFDNDSIVTLKNLKTVFPCVGCGSPGGLTGASSLGVETSYVIPDNLIDSFKNLGVAKFRLYTAKGFLEEEIKKKANLIKELIALVQPS